MQFIIPKNYKFKPKLLGLLDYQTAVLNGIWAGILYLLSNIIFKTLTHKLYFICVLFLPFLLFTIIGVNNESIISVSLYIIKYFKRQKIYLYKKNKWIFKNNSKKTALDSVQLLFFSILKQKNFLYCNFKNLMI